MLNQEPLSGATLSDCTIAKRWIEKEVQSPVEQFMTRLEQACEDFRQAYEELVEQSVSGSRNRRNGSANRGRGHSTCCAAW